MVRTIAHIIDKVEHDGDAADDGDDYDDAANDDDDADVLRTKHPSSCNNPPPTPCHDYHTHHLLFSHDDEDEDFDFYEDKGYGLINNGKCWPYA